MKDYLTMANDTTITYTQGHDPLSKHNQVNLNLILEPTSNGELPQPFFKDPGNHDPSHFKPYMSPFRFQIRTKLEKYTHNQSTYLSRWQQKYRTPFRDILFQYSASLGSHTFYVLCLPIPAWLGYYESTKDLVYIIGLSIYLSGYLKDFLCLPRPKNPPLKRITLSEMTTKEYGAPSSHTANAVGVSLYLLIKVWSEYETDNDLMMVMTSVIFSLLILGYCLILTIGRLYCGMHGLLDIYMGIIIGFICTISRLVFSMIPFQMGQHWWFPIYSITLYLNILFYHIRPIDECPCFDDTVAFIGVISGLECSDWFIQYFHFGLVYNFEKASLLILMIRLMIGIPSVIIWKYVLSKRFVNFIVKTLLRVKDDRLIRLEKLREETEKRKRLNECLPFCGVSRFDIITRFIIYAGIPITVMLISPIPISYIERYLFELVKKQ